MLTQNSGHYRSTVVCSCRGLRAEGRQVGLWELDDAVRMLVLNSNRYSVQVAIPPELSDLDQKSIWDIFEQNMRHMYGL
jgi:hypothetical protein